MSEFNIFSQAVKQQLDKMIGTGSELFVVDVSGDQVWDAYLGAFPAGTNEIFRERTEHDCSCCRHFIRNIGNIVVVQDDELHSVWRDLKGLPHPYNVVAEALGSLVESANITGIYRTTPNFTAFGKEHNVEQLASGGNLTWHHFHGQVPKRLALETAATAVGEYATSVQMMNRGFAELAPAAFDTVVDLIQSDNLYRGAEFLKAVTDFREQQQIFNSLLGDRLKHLYLWISAGPLNHVARFRNTMIGTLLVDLSEGMQVDQAVAAYEKKAAPENYKRPKAVITQRMVDDAMKTIDELGIEPSLARRHAKLSDVHVDNVLWVNNSVKGQMRGALHDVLSSAVVKEPPKSDSAIDIGIEQFMADVLPAATDLRALVRNGQQNNLVSITTAQNADSPQLFKWTNNFAWSYNGNLTDSAIRSQVQAKGGRVDGVLRFSHSWNYGKRNASLMDLHVFMPGNDHKSGQHDEYGNPHRVGWNNRKHLGSGGVQDVDYVEAAPVGYVPVENITFPDLGKLKDGQYLCKIHNWNLRTPTEGGFRAEIEFEGQVFEYEVDRPLAHKEWVDVATVTLKDGKFSIQHHLPTTKSSQDVWGIHTETLVKVDTVMFSPNFWDGGAVGNKHWFFLLNECKNPDPVRGISNEFLVSELDKHRKVFEVLGAKTMCVAGADQPQLSGVGFSSTKRDSLLLEATSASGRRLYNIKF